MAEASNALAQHRLARIYYYGPKKITQANCKKAFEWCKKSANNGYIAAINDLGIYYECGRGTKTDEYLAFKYISDAAEKGYVMAQFNLFLFYQSGIGTKANDELAFKWCQKASEEKEHPFFLEIVEELALCYLIDKGVKVDHNKSFELFKQTLGDEIANYFFKTFVEISISYGYEELKYNLRNLHKMKKLREKSASELFKVITLKCGSIMPLTWQSSIKFWLGNKLLPINQSH